MKFRVLCLHGYTQNAQKFRDRLGPFRRGLKNQVDLVFLTAPHKATRVFESTDPQDADESMAWWNQSDDKDGVEREIMASVEAVREKIKEEGPFDGIMGFSQGAGMAAIVAALAESGGGGWRPFRFAMFFAGFYPEQMAAFGDTVGKSRLGVPSLHVVGECDAVVPRSRGVELATRAFEDPEIRSHPGGHFVPCNAEWRRTYQEFLAKIDAAPDL